MKGIFSLIFSHKELVLESKKENPHIKHGNILLKSGGVCLLGGFLLSLSLTFSEFKLSIFIDTRISVIVLIVGIIQIVIGLYLVLSGLSNTKKTWSNKIFYYLRGMSNQSDDPPFSALPKMATWYSPVLVKIKIDPNLPDSIYTDLQFAIKIITEKINQYKENEVFFAGMARVPCLFFLGYAFRNAHGSVITLIEHIHQSDKWMKLRETDNIELDTMIEINIKDKNLFVSDISILVEFICEIPRNDLPLHLQDNIVRIRLTKDYEHNQIESRKTIERIVENIVNQLVIHNKKCRKLHLFISAQSTIVFSLGRRYQDGMIGNIIVYQYNPFQNRYSWAISLINNSLKLEKFD
jgi:hypothetical protein